MSNITTTNIDNASVDYANCVYDDDTATFTGADTLVAGTIMARRAVATAITPAAGSNTGNGTCTLATVVDGPVVPKVGNYVLTCITAVTNGGVFRLVDPDGNIVAGYLPMTAGAGTATAFQVAGIGFTLTDASTDFIVGDSFTLPIVASGKLVPYSASGVGGAQFPLCVLDEEIVATGSGDKKCRPIKQGQVRFSKLVIDADGDNTNVTAAVIDQLQGVGIVVIHSTQLSAQDNQ